MDNENSIKRTNELKTNEINAKDVNIYNIRKNDNGLYFDIKIPGDNGKNIADLFIPSKFYQQIESYYTRRGLIVISKAKLVEYFLVYPGALASLVLIISTFFRYLPILKNLFNIVGF